jgi:phosphonate transport system substrate-binding protein
MVPTRACRPVVLWVAAVLLAGCSRGGERSYAPAYTAQSSPAAAPYRFGVHPLHNPQRLAEVYGPVVARVNRGLAGPRLELEASLSYDDFERKLAARELAFALPNPLQALNALKSGYRIFGKMGDDAAFRGIILVRKDGGIRTVADLKGKVVSFPAPTALAATMMPLHFLHTHGLDANRDVVRLFAGSQESSIMSVYLRSSVAGATWPPPWLAFQKRNPSEAAELEVRWETAPLVNNGLVARDDVPEALVARVAELLFAMHTDDEGRRLLAELPLSRFEPASEASYAPVKAFLEAYAREIR